MENVEIVKLSPDKWEQYKNLRVDAVKKDPLAFGLTPDEYLTYPDNYWQKELEKAEKEEDAWIYFAKIEDQLVGMLAANRVNKIRMRHLAHIHSMSVKKEFRGRGIARKLMETVLNKLEGREDLLMAQMGVASSQTAALTLYKQFGFEVVGTRKKVFRDGDDFYDEILMEKVLHQNT